MKIKPIHGIDYVVEHGKRVWTREYLLKKGRCCRHGCKNCPWDFKHENIRTNRITETTSSVET